MKMNRYNSARKKKAFDFEIMFLESERIVTIHLGHDTGNGDRDWKSPA
ncbi:hypothetical protein KAR91_41720 [Candidatus Pacearchaeota archaeon]|nr:hypothetical protein [Candidatus Pacearchaeota archaeon]